MSDLFNSGEPPRRPGRGVAAAPPRSRALWITLAIVVALFVAFALFSSWWTERLWFGSVGYETVFSTMLRTRIGLFLTFGLLMAFVVGLNLALAYRFRPIFRPASPEQISLDRYRQAITPIRTWLLVGISLLLGIFAGVTASGRWREYLLWRNGTDFDKNDPYFDRDIGFFVFDLPWLHFIVNFLMAVLAISLIAAALVHYVFGGIRLQSKQDRFSGAAAVQLSVLLGLFVLVKAADYYLDRFDLLTAGGGLNTGMNFTDDNAVLPAKNILMFIAIICAVLFFANVVWRTWLLPSVGLSLLVLSAILLGMIWPAVVQQFQVNPSQASKEEPYLQKNIDATRDAFDIADAEVEPYTGQTALTAAEQSDELANVPGIRLVDPALIKATFDQQQQVQGYYGVADVLDVDRYTINGQERDVVIGVRELNQDGLPEDSKNWSNLHTVYTHGYGVIAAYGNQREADNKTVVQGEPSWAEEALPPTGALTDLTEGGYRGQIYFGEKSPEYSIVGKAKDDDRDVELDIPSNDEGGNKMSTYTGAAGVEVGSTFRQMLYAWKFSEPNILLSSRVNENSKILYDRDPRTMVEKVAPWLTVDADPFPAVVDGKIVWLLDGYTTSDQYPQAQKESYQTMTSDSLDSGNEFRTLATDEINYMRNAVKAVVDAYDGTVTLYAWDESDPMLKAWRSAFPDTVKERSEIPADLLGHMRYPEDMFKVQRYQMAAYHVDDASTFYEGNSRWKVPEDPTSRGSLQPPYRLSINTTADDEQVFSLTSVFVPNKRENLAAFISVDGDASKESYGTMRVLELPRNNAVPGPGQMANEFNTNETIQGVLEPLLKNSNLRVINGNLLTLPVGDGLLYVQPIYTIRTGDSTANYPILRYVTVAFGDKKAIGTTVADAVRNVLDLGSTPSIPDEPEEGETPSTPDPELSGPVADQIRTLLNQADAKFKEANAALAQDTPDLTAYAQATKEAERLVARALTLAQRDQGAQGE